MSFEFKPEDFNTWEQYPKEANITVVMAQIANAKLDEYLKTLPKVLGHNSASEGWCFWELPGSDDTHTARLIDIQPIEGDGLWKSVEYFTTVA